MDRAPESLDPPPDELGFVFLSARLCLHLVATVGERWRRSFERLRRPDDLARWYVEAGLLDEPPAIDEDHLASARELREAVHRLGLAAMGRGGRDPADVARLNAAAARPDLAPQLDDGAITRVAVDDPAARALATVARDAVDLLGGSLAGRIRQCSAQDCALMFLDRSRGESRKWCSMRACGNRTKLAAYRQRSRSA